MNEKLAGELLRNLRDERNLGSNDFATIVSATTLSRLENGHSTTAKRITVMAILDRLDEASPVSFITKKKILELYGFSPDGTVPDRIDIRNALMLWRERKDSHYPSYLVDYAQRIHDWNQASLSLLGLSSISEIPKGITVFDLAFDPRYQQGLEIENGEEFLVSMVNIMKREFTPFMHLDWCKDCIKKARGKYEVFGTIWDSLPQPIKQEVGIRVISPLRIRTNTGHILTFTLLGADLIEDPRFRIVQYIPDPETAAYFSS